jgi:hypothetical protein
LIFSPRTHGSQILLVKRRCGSLEQSIGPARAVGGTCMKKRRAGRDVVALWQPSALARPAPPRAVASLFQQIPSDLSGPTPSELGAGSWLPRWNWHWAARQGPRARNGNSSTPPVRRKARR